MKPSETTIPDRAPNKIKGAPCLFEVETPFIFMKLNRVEDILKVVLPKIFLQLLNKENSYSPTKCQACASTKPGKARVAIKGASLKKNKK